MSGIAVYELKVYLRLHERKPFQLTVCAESCECSYTDMKKGLMDATFLSKRSNRKPLC